MSSPNKFLQTAAGRRGIALGHGRRALSGELAHLLLAVSLGVVLAAVPLWHDSGTYFRDDMEAQWAPTLTSIARTLWADGAIPFLTTKVWIGGNLAGEYQYGLFNPVLLGLVALLPAFSDLAAAMAFLVLCFSAILASGAFVLARALGLSIPLAHVAAAAIAGNNMLTYWFAASWFPGYATTAFVLWALAGILRAHRGPWLFLGAAFGTWLTATAGFSHGIIVLGIFTAIRVLVLWREAGVRPALDVALAAGLGVGAAGVAILPLLGLAGLTIRENIFGNNGFLLPNLRDVLTLSSPLHMSLFAFMPGRSPFVQAPIFHAAWFVLPVATLIDWRRFDWRDRRVLTMLAFGCAMLIGTQGPSHVGWMRFPIKFLPYFQIAAVLVALLALQRPGFAPPSRGRTLALCVAMGLSALSSIQSAPALMPLHVGFAAIAGYAAFLLQRDAARHRTALATVLAVTTWLGAASLRAVPAELAPPGVAVFQPFGAPREAVGAVSLSEIPYGAEFQLAWIPAGLPRQTHIAVLPWGNMALTQGRAVIVGYSPVGHAGIHRLLCGDAPEGSCGRDRAARVLARDSETGAAPADLMRLRRIVAERGPELDGLRELVGPPWQEVGGNAIAVIVERPLPSADLPGSLAWPIAGLRAESLGTPKAEREVLRILDRDPASGPLLFARLYWHGYTARFEGVPVPVRAHDDVFVAVDLPSGATRGDLVLSFTPKGLIPGLVVSAVSVLALIGYAALLHGARRRRIRSDART